MKNIVKSVVLSVAIVMSSIMAMSPQPALAYHIEEVTLTCSGSGNVTITATRLNPLRKSLAVQWNDMTRPRESEWGQSLNEGHPLKYYFRAGWIRKSTGSLVDNHYEYTWTTTTRDRTCGQMRARTGKRKWNNYGGWNEING